MKKRTTIKFAGDFETTVYEGQEYTEVWASGLCEFGTENVLIFHSIGETFDYLKSLKAHCLVYYHNLKFDGTFWLSYLMDVLKMQQAYVFKPDSDFEGYFLPEKEMKNNTFSYSISDRGQWYYITIKVNNHFIEIRDSLKLLPFSLAAIGKSFKTKHQKLEMVYEGFRYAGCEITPEERKYLENDVLVLKEALEIMYAEGHDRLTIASCCYAEFKNITGFWKFKDLYPDLTKLEFKDHNKFDAVNADQYIRRSYRGGWCYLVPEKAHKVTGPGFTLDVNSLYPSMMHSMSGNKFPVRYPTFWKGNFIPDRAKENYFFVRFKTRFYLKEGYLPFVQIKGSWNYKSTECLKTSDVWDPETKKYYKDYYDLDGNVKNAIVTLTMTCIDFKLFMEHYNVEDFEILDGCWFRTMTGIFDEYIDKYAAIKKTATGSRRSIAKLFLNSLYGRTAANTDSSFKFAYLDENDAVNFYPVDEFNKKAGYIPVGSAITSYARNFTIRAAQANYYGPDQPGFVYSDTDSVHICGMDPKDIKGIELDPAEFCKWKAETYWDHAYFVRAKTYIEHVTHEDGQPVPPWYNVKCAGMPDKCKDLFIKSMTGYEIQPGDEYDDEEREFIEKRLDITDFDVGLRVKGKLLPKRIKGGTILVNSYFEMRKI